MEFRRIIEESWLFFNFRFLKYHKILLLEFESNNTFLTKIYWVNHSNSKLLYIFRVKCFLNDQNLSTESRLLEPKTFSEWFRQKALCQNLVHLYHWISESHWIWHHQIWLFAQHFIYWICNVNLRQTFLRISISNENAFNLIFHANTIIMKSERDVIFCE